MSPRLPVTRVWPVAGRPCGLRSCAPLLPRCQTRVGAPSLGVTFRNRVMHTVTIAWRAVDRPAPCRRPFWAAVRAASCARREALSGRPGGPAGAAGLRDPDHVTSWLRIPGHSLQLLLRLQGARPWLRTELPGWPLPRKHHAAVRRGLFYGCNVPDVTGGLCRVPAAQFAVSCGVGARRGDFLRLCPPAGFPRGPGWLLTEQGAWRVLGWGPLSRGAGRLPAQLALGLGREGFFLGCAQLCGAHLMASGCARGTAALPAPPVAGDAGTPTPLPLGRAPRPGRSGRRSLSRAGARTWIPASCCLVAQRHPSAFCLQEFIKIS